MIATINDPGLISVLESQLRNAGMSWLEIIPQCDRHVYGHPFAIYRSSLCNTDGVVFDAWIVSGGQSSNELPFGSLYNLDNYPVKEEALASHIGRLVLGTHLQLVQNDETHKKK